MTESANQQESLGGEADVGLLGQMRTLGTKRLGARATIALVLALTVAAGVYKWARQDTPEVEHALHNGDAAMDTGRYDAALKAYSEALRRRPDNERARIGVFKAQVLANPPFGAQLMAAQQRLESLRAEHPDDPHLPLVLARLAQAEGASERARALYGDVLKLNPDLPDTWFAMGTLAESQGDKEDAREAFKRAVQLAPAQPNYLASLARVQMALGDYAGALKSYERVLRIPPAQLRVRLDSANAARLAGKLNRSDEHLVRLVDDLRQQGALSGRENSGEWVFDGVSNPVELKSADSKRAYGLLDAALTNWLAGDRATAAQEIREALSLPDTASAQAVIAGDLNRLKAARPEWQSALGDFEKALSEPSERATGPARSSSP
jgi:tetratricopeptide (TPR) repeat protein